MGFRLGKNKINKTIYKYFPKNKPELIEILEKRLDENKNDDLNDIDVSNIIYMSSLFYGLDPHNIDISEWDVSNVIDMAQMFCLCKNFNSNLSDWNISKVEDISYIFYKCNKFEGEGLENWNVSRVQNMEGALDHCDSLKKLPSWYNNKI